MKKTLKLTVALFTVCSTLNAKDVIWFNGHQAVSYCVKGKTAPVVETALQMFADDMQLVTGQKAKISKNGIIEVYELDRNRGAVGQLRKRGVPVDSVVGRHDCFWLGARDGKIIAVGSNGRGCAYAILELSRQAGVSPWVWWADVVPEPKRKLTFKETLEKLQAPSVAYRGIFINDEDWTIKPWAWLNYDKSAGKGVISAKTYRQLFKLLLRLRANAIWPGMHSGTKAFYKVPGAMQAADSCGIVVGTSHCEPMMRNNVGEWDHRKMGDYNYVTNKAGVQQYWIERLKEAGKNENFYTIGMRGIHDGAMEGVGSSLDGKTRWLQNVIDDQRKLLKKYVHNDLTKIPQQFVPYKEVLSVMENGLQVPDDVMLTWCDDNYGYMTRLSDSEQQKRSGGSGLLTDVQYYIIDL